VCRGLTGGAGAIVARGTTARGHGTVIESRGQPRGGAVTAITRGRGHDMITGLATCAGAIVARGATARGHRGVIHGRWLPRRGGVTAITR